MTMSGCKVRRDIPSIPGWLLENIATLIATHPNTKRFYEISDLYAYLSKRLWSLGVADNERCFMTPSDKFHEHSLILWYSNEPKHVTLDDDGNTIGVTALHAYYGTLVLFTDNRDDSKWPGYMVLDVPSSPV
jgi:hypothetical protein